MGLDRHKLPWDGTEKYVPWTSLTLWHPSMVVRVDDGRARTSLQFIDCSRPVKNKRARFL